MEKIEVRVFNPEAAKFGEKMMVFGSRLTQRNHVIKTMDDLYELYERPYKNETCEMMLKLPHANPKRFSFIVVGIVGASLRFRNQITRHQDDCHFISGSLQYSDHTGNVDFCIPYSVTKNDAERVGNAELEQGYFTRNYLASQRQQAAEYERAIAQGLDHDAAGYLMPSGQRVCLLIGATPFQWIHMISQRVCRRNTLETQYVMCKIWEELWPLSPMFHLLPGPDCMHAGGCREGEKFGCRHFFYDSQLDDYAMRKMCSIPTAFLDLNYPLIRDIENR